MGPRPHLSFYACKTSVISSRISSLYGSQTSSVVFCMRNSDWFVPELQVSMSPRPHLMWFFACKRVTVWPELTSLYTSQTTPVVELCMQNNENSIRITSHYRSRPSSVALCMQNNVTLGPELLISIGPGPHLSFCAWKTTWFSNRITSLCMDPSTSFMVFCMQNSDLQEPELQVSLSPSTSTMVFWIHYCDFMNQNYQVSMRPRPLILLFCEFTTTWH